MSKNNKPKDEFPHIAIQVGCEIYGTLIRDYNIPSQVVIDTIANKYPGLLADTYVLTVMAHDDTLDDLIEGIRREIQGEQEVYGTHRHTQSNEIQEWLRVTGLHSNPHANE